MIKLFIKNVSNNKLEGDYVNKEFLNKIFKDVDENKKQVVETMFDDFIHEYELLEKLKPQIKKYQEPKSQREADKLKQLTKIYSDTSQRHDSKVKIFLSALNKFEGAEEDEFETWVKNKKG